MVPSHSRCAASVGEERPNPLDGKCNLGGLSGKARPVRSQSRCARPLQLEHPCPLSPGVVTSQLQRCTGVSRGAGGRVAGGQESDVQLGQSPTCMLEANGATDVCDGPILRNRQSDGCREEDLEIVLKASEKPRPLMREPRDAST